MVARIVVPSQVDVDILRINGDDDGSDVSDTCVCVSAVEFACVLDVKETAQRCDTVVRVHSLPSVEASLQSGFAHEDGTRLRVALDFV